MMGLIILSILTIYSTIIMTGVRVLTEYINSRRFVDSFALVIVPRVNYYRFGVLFLANKVVARNFLTTS
ncbi:MAG: hypothetical protein ACJASB_002125 [Shewanella psychromarinicola]|jgi:hypothetical protein